MFFLLFFGPLTKKFAHHWCGDDKGLLKKGAPLCKGEKGVR